MSLAKKKFRVVPIFQTQRTGIFKCLDFFTQQVVDKHVQHDADNVEVERRRLFALVVYNSVVRAGIIEVLSTGEK